jgi:hypothetical protein
MHSYGCLVRVLGAKCVGQAGKDPRLVLVLFSWSAQRVVLYFPVRECVIGCRALGLLALSGSI